MNYAEIKYNDIANGPGVRTSLFVSGCKRHCEGCFNEIAWNFNYGKRFDRGTWEQIIKLTESRFIQGISILGGEPMEPVNQMALLPFVREFRDRLPDKDVWLFTGYTLESDIMDGEARCDATDELLSLIDVMVDGEFILAKKNLMLRFRGSENQRIIDLKKSLSEGEIVLWEDKHE